MIDHSLITCDQSAFMKGHSTQTATIKLFDDILNNINDGFINGACFFDLAKCFDSIDHEVLLIKMEKYGIRGSELSWFLNYLSERSQVVAVNGLVSEFDDVTTGVPQGSVLGPILFLICINDLPSCLTTTSGNIFADDTAIHSCGATVSEVERLLQHDADNITKWFDRNKLTVNADKCFSMLFSSNPHVNKSQLCLNVGTSDIDCLPSARYLGIYPDSNLRWEEHISKLCNTISPKIGLLHRLKKILPTDHVEMVYRSIVQPHIDYCITLWGYAANKYIKKVQSLQNRAARIITGNFDFYTTRGITLVKKLNWQTVVQRRDYFTSLLVHKTLNGNAPSHMEDLFTYSNVINTRSTRLSDTNSLYVPRVNKKVFGQSVQYNGPIVWNALPQTLRDINDFNKFKVLAKKHFV